MTDRFIAGIIGAPFGLKGFVKVKPLSGEIEHLLTLKTACLRQNDKEQILTIEESSAIPPAVAMRFAGYHDPQAARALHGAQLLVSREQAAPLHDGEFYIEDLKGLALCTDDGQVMGHISTIIEGGGGDLAEIRLCSGEVKLIPFRHEFISAIDLAGKQALLHNVWILE